MKLQVILQFFVAVILTLQGHARDFDYCYAYDEDPYLLMGTKTAYQFVQGKSRLKPVPNCTPVQIWILTRHGTRFPGKKSIIQLSTLPKLRDQIVYNHEIRGNGHMCNSDLEYLKKWQLSMNLNNFTADTLTRQGEQDMRLFAKRLQSEFSKILQPEQRDINNQNYKFRATKSQRTQASLEAFMDGLFNDKNAVLPEIPPVEDTLLHPDKYCPAWESDTARSYVDMESDKFINGPEYQNLIQNVSRRLGFAHRINNDSVQLMYDMCRYEKAWDVTRLSAWCSVFSKEEMKILEYLEDLDYYYYSGPGRDINGRLACNLVKDMFNHFKNLEQGNFNEEPKGVFYFTHSVPLHNFLAALSIGKDFEPLLASNYRTMEKRSFKTSIIGSFAANMVAIFYRCSDPRSPNKVMFYLDEMAVTLENCSVGLCDWNYLKQRFGSFADQCNLDFCYNVASTSISMNFILLSFVSLIVLLLPVEL